MRPLISHETPLSIINDSDEWNDFDYALVHLFEDNNPEYFNFFQDSLAKGREVLLDNSIFELKVAFDAGKFAEWIKLLKPTYYIVPDALEDCDKTISQFEDWLENYACECPGRRIGVVQGKTLNEIIKCYDYMSKNADYIALSFDLSIYQVIGCGATKLDRMASGRQNILNILHARGVWNKNKPHHLLGCSVLSEFSTMKNFVHEDVIKSIRSIDTSNPIIAAMEGSDYNCGGKHNSDCTWWGGGLVHKSKSLLADNLNNKIDKLKVLSNTDVFAQAVEEGFGL